MKAGILYHSSLHPLDQPQPDAGRISSPVPYLQAEELEPVSEMSLLVTWDMYHVIENGLWGRQRLCSPRPFPWSPKATRDGRWLVCLQWSRAGTYDRRRGPLLVSREGLSSFLESGAEPSGPGVPSQKARSPVPWSSALFPETLKDRGLGLDDLCEMHRHYFLSL